MKSLLIIAIILIGCQAEDTMTYPGRWVEGAEITVRLDPSLEKLASPDEIYPLVEDGFHRWLDETDSNITINFEYRKCSFVAGVSCVTAADTDEQWLGLASADHGVDGEITAGKIQLNLNQNWGDGGYSLEYTILHEVGHFFGVHHSDNPDDVMFAFGYAGGEGCELSDNDTMSIHSLYK